MITHARNATDAIETTPLLSTREAVETAPLKYREVTRSYRSMRKAFEKDSLMCYFVAADKFPRLRPFVVSHFNYAAGVYQKRMLTVDGGVAFMKYAWPGNSTNPWFFNAGMRTMDVFTTAELKKRHKEFGDKTKVLVEDAFGDKAAEMYEIQALATDPAAQGRGYGSALVQYVIEKSDSDGRDIWLVTTDAYAFYEYLGFTKVRSGLVGNDNPAWDGAPISIYIMYRASKLSPKSDVPAVENV